MYCFLCHKKMHDEVFQPTSCLCMALLTTDERPLLDNLVKELQEASFPFKKFTEDIVPEKDSFTFCSYCADVFKLSCERFGFQPKCPICHVAIGKLAIFENQLEEYLYDDIIETKDYVKIRPVLNNLYAEWDKKTDINFADLVKKQ